MPQEQEVEDDTSSVYSESSSSLSSDDESIFDPHDAANELKLLEEGIKLRKALLLKLLSRKEGTEIAKTLQGDENRVNSYLLESLREQIQSQSEESKPSVVSSRSSSSTVEEDKQSRHGGRIQTIKLDKITLQIVRVGIFSIFVKLTINNFHAFSFCQFPAFWNCYG